MMVTIDVDDAGWNDVPGLEELAVRAIDATVAALNVAHDDLETAILFTSEEAIAALNAHREGVVFILWGSHAQRKGAFIDTRKHLVIQSPHPSPLSAHRGFIGCGHFSAANRWLSGRKLGPIDWRLPPVATLPPPDVSG